MALTTSPRIGILIPDVGQGGPLYAQNLFDAFLKVDSHNHTENNNKVPVAGINIDADLDVQTQSVLNISEMLFSTFTGTNGLRTLSVNAAGELVYTSGANKVTPITQNGAINISSAGSITGIEDSAALVFQKDFESFTFINSTGTALASLVGGNVEITSSAGGVGTLTYLPATSALITLPSVSGTLSTALDVDAALATQTSRIYNTPVINTPTVTDGTFSAPVITGGTVTDVIRNEMNTTVITVPSQTVVFNSESITTQRLNVNNDVTIDVQGLASGQELNLLISSNSSSTITVTFTGIILTDGTTINSLEVTAFQLVQIRMDKIDTVTWGNVFGAASPTAVTLANDTVLGTFTWEVPTGVTLITADVAAGGGGGARGGSPINGLRPSSGAGGGGGGAFVAQEDITVLPGNTLTFVVRAGGGAASAGGVLDITGNFNGSAGQTLSFAGGSPGGAGGTASTNFGSIGGGGGGAGGVGVLQNTETTISGGAGGAGPSASTTSSPAGATGGATSSAAGGSGGGGTNGGGGNHASGGGGGGASFAMGGNGSAGAGGSAPGAGGGGGGAGFLVGAGAGGAGANSGGAGGAGGNGGFSFSYLLPIGSEDNALVGP